MQWKLCGKVIGKGYVHQWREALSRDSTRKCRRQVYRSTRGKRFRKGRRRVGVRLWNRARFFERKTKSRDSRQRLGAEWRQRNLEVSSGKNSARQTAKSFVFPQTSSWMLYVRWFPLRVLLFVSCFAFSYSFFFFREHFLAGNHAAFFRNDLQSSTPEEYLDGWIFADEAGLGNGPLAVKSDGGLSAQSGIDDRRDLLFLFQRLLLVSAKKVSRQHLSEDRDFRCRINF